MYHPTRLSVGPAQLTTAIYLNVIGSKLAPGRGVSKEGQGAPRDFPEAVVCGWGVYVGWEGG